jgi:hypothetical protein
MLSRLERSRRRSSTLAIAAAVAGLLAATAAVASAAAPHPRAVHRRHLPPPRLVDTGLYSDFAARSIDPRNLHYVPQYPLWSDGAAKQRWVYLPPGTAIDARDPESWVFPVGTKFWKEFAWGRRVETRYIERTRDGWVFASYLWAEDESDAVLAPEQGVLSTQEVAPGRRHPIPSVADCLNCHQNGRAAVLGFAALQLSPDRDPLALHAEALTGDAVTLDTLVARRLVRGHPRSALDPPPRIAASTPRGRAVLGYLHANCGNCHDSVGSLAGLGLALRHALVARDPSQEPAAGVIGHVSRFRPRGAPAGENFWVDPGAPSRSTVLTRLASRNPMLQMPPLGTQLVDEQAVALITAWIEQDLHSNGGGPQR